MDRNSYRLTNDFIMQRNLHDNRRVSGTTEDFKKWMNRPMMPGGCFTILFNLQNNKSIHG